MGRSTSFDGRHSADLYGRWQALQLLNPVFELLNRAAPRADFDHRGYDLAQLALRLVDYVVLNQASLEGSVSPDSIVDHIGHRRTGRTREVLKDARAITATCQLDGRGHREPPTGGEGALSRLWRKLAAHGGCGFARMPYEPRRRDPRPPALSRRFTCEVPG